MKPEKTLKENLIYEGKILSLYNDEVLVENGTSSRREYVRHNGGVCVAAVNEKGEIYMVRQYRYAYREEVLELPAGKLEKGEDPYLAGIRELKEETGLTAEKVVSLGKFYPTPGYTNEVIHMYYAIGLRSGEQSLDEDEFLSVEKISLDKAREMILSGEIKDGKTIAAISKLLLGETK